MTPRRSSRSKPACTSASQCLGTAAGECIATGFAVWSTNNLSGGESFISGNGCCSQTLNALAAYRSNIYCLNMWTFSLEGVQGRVGGDEGGGCLVGQEHGTSAGLDTPVLLQGFS